MRTYTLDELLALNEEEFREAEPTLAVGKALLHVIYADAYMLEIRDWGTVSLNLLEAIHGDSLTFVGYKVARLPESDTWSLQLADDLIILKTVSGIIFRQKAIAPGLWNTESISESEAKRLVNQFGEYSRL